jgi:pimeloyl-ACP methyl ester carboxylesterase
MIVESFKAMGTGPTVLWLLPDGVLDVSPLAERIAEDHRVVLLAAQSPDSGAFVLIGQSRGAAAALALARAAGKACEALILLAPVFASLPAPDAVPDVPTLLLLGTNDTSVPPSAAAALCAALPRAHPMLIYGAGHALDRERVEAVAAVVRDFIARREKFIVRAASDVIYP